LRRIEKTIEKLEQKKKQLEENFLQSDPKLEDLQRWDKELKEVNAKLSETEHDWLILSEQM